MKKILFFTPVLVSGGAERTIRNLVKYIKNLYPQYEVYECVMHYDPKDKLPDYVIPMKNDTLDGCGRIVRLYRKIAQIFELRKIKKNYGVDACISFLPGADMVNVLSRGKEKVVISLRNNPNNLMDNTGTLYHWLHRYSIKHADYIVALSDYVRKSAINLYGIPESKITTIYNPTPEFQKLEEPELCRRLRNKNEKILITAGRLTEQKGQWHLLKALKEVLMHNKHISLIVLGKGPLEMELKRIAEELGISENVYFLGFVDNAPEYIKYSDIFVFPSIFEGLGNVLIEALSLGVPIISSDCPYGPREILAPGTEYKNIQEEEYAEYGILVPYGSKHIEKELSDDEKCLAHAIIKLLSDEKLLRHYQKKALERAAFFDPDAIAALWDGIV